MSRLCSHNGTIDYDETTEEYYCTRCGDVVPKPENWGEDEEDEI